MVVNLTATASPGGRARSTVTATAVLPARLHAPDTETRAKRTMIGQARRSTKRALRREPRARLRNSKPGARPGVPCQAVDQAARKVIEDAGFGPGYGFNGQACADLAKHGGFHGFTQNGSS